MALLFSDGSTDQVNVGSAASVDNLAALSVLSVLLYWRFPIHVWSVFANLLLLPLVGMMFLAEYLYRWLTYRWFGHATLAQSVMAFQRLRAARAARMVHRRG